MYNLFSKNKILLLELFYRHPNESYYLQEIGKIVGKKGGVYQRALNDLEAEGIIKSNFRGNLRLFEINKTYPLYKEMKKIILTMLGKQKKIDGI